jgi:hypothetical protein
VDKRLKCPLYPSLFFSFVFLFLLSFHFLLVSFFSLSLFLSFPLPSRKPHELALADPPPDLLPARSWSPLPTRSPPASSAPHSDAPRLLLCAADAPPGGPSSSPCRCCPQPLCLRRRERPSLADAATISGHPSVGVHLRRPPSASTSHAQAAVRCRRPLTVTCLFLKGANPALWPHASRRSRELVLSTPRVAKSAPKNEIPSCFCAAAVLERCLVALLAPHREQSCWKRYQTNPPCTQKRRSKP